MAGLRGKPLIARTHAIVHDERRPALRRAFVRGHLRTVGIGAVAEAPRGAR